MTISDKWEHSQRRRFNNRPIKRENQTDKFMLDFIHEETKEHYLRYSKKLFKKRLKICLDKRIGTDRIIPCSPEYHARVLDVHRTTIMRYIDLNNDIFPPLDKIFLLIAYIEHFIENFNPAYLFDEKAEMTRIIAKNPKEL